MNKIPNTLIKFHLGLWYLVPFNTTFTVGNQEMDGTYTEYFVRNFSFLFFTLEIMKKTQVVKVDDKEILPENEPDIDEFL
jgi:hypothetical protein